MEDEQNPVNYSYVPIGTVLAYIGPASSVYNTGWLPCDGSAIPQSCVTLIGIIGNNTPMLNGLVLVGSATAASGTVYATNQPQSTEPVGEESHTLALTEMPSHTHQYYIAGGPKNQSGSDTACLTIAEDSFAYTTATGGNQDASTAPHNNMQPYYVVTYIVYAGSELNETT